MLLIAFIATNLLWAGMYFAMWFYYEKRDIKRLEELIALHQRLKSGNEQLAKGEAAMVDAAVTINKLCDRCDELKAYINTLTGKRAEA